MNERGGTSEFSLEVAASDVENTTLNNVDIIILDGSNPVGVVSEAERITQEASGVEESSSTEGCRTIGRIACGSCPMALFCLDASGNPNKVENQEDDEKPKEEPTEPKKSYLEELLSPDDSKIVVAVPETSMVDKGPKDLQKESPEKITTAPQAKQPKPEISQSTIVVSEVVEPAPQTVEASQIKIPEVVIEIGSKPVTVSQPVGKTNPVVKIAPNEVTSNKTPNANSPEVITIQNSPVKSVKSIDDIVEQSQPASPAQLTAEPGASEIKEIDRHQSAPAKAHLEEVVASGGNEEAIEPIQAVAEAEVDTTSIYLADVAERPQAMTEVATNQAETVEKSSEPIIELIVGATTSDKPILVEEDMAGQYQTTIETEVGATTEVEFASQAITEITTDLTIEISEPSEQLPDSTIDIAVLAPYISYTPPDVAPMLDLVPALDVVSGQDDREIVPTLEITDFIDTPSVDSSIRLADEEVVVVRLPEDDTISLEVQEVVDRSLDDAYEVEATIDNTTTMLSQPEETLDGIALDDDFEVAVMDYTQDGRDSSPYPELAETDESVGDHDYNLTNLVSSGGGSLSGHFGGVRQVAVIGMLAIFMALKTKTARTLRIAKFETLVS